MVNRKFQIGVLAFCIMLFSTSMIAQTQKWKDAKTKDGKISTKYKISSRTNENGEDVPLIEMVTTAIEKISIDKCIALARNVSRHKDFHGDDSSNLVKVISDHEWVLYYYTEGTLFSPDADGVYTMTFNEDPLGKIASFRIEAAPTLVEERGVKRVTYLNETFTFKDLGNGLIQITMTSNMSPAFQVPGWILKMSFPDLAFKVMENFIKLAHDEQSK